jgi:tRNA threonylcarbamoyladenosine biosynthesis protein TsaE
VRLFSSDSPADTHAVAARLAAELEPGAVLALHGELGSGKTCFVQGLARALGVAEIVSSPSYLILHEYHGRLDLNHMDLYRLDSEAEVLAFGFEEYLEANAVLAIEWPEVADRLLPEDTIHIHFECGEDEQRRAIRIEGARPC